MLILLHAYRFECALNFQLLIFLSSADFRNHSHSCSYSTTLAIWAAHLPTEQKLGSINPDKLHKCAEITPWQMILRDLELSQLKKVGMHCSNKKHKEQNLDLCTTTLGLSSVKAQICDGFIPIILYMVIIFICMDKQWHIPCYYEMVVRCVLPLQMCVNSWHQLIFYLAAWWQFCYLMEVEIHKHNTKYSVILAAVVNISLWFSDCVYDGKLKA